MRGMNDAHAGVIEIGEGREGEREALMPEDRPAATSHSFCRVEVLNVW